MRGSSGLELPSLSLAVDRDNLLALVGAHVSMLVERAKENNCRHTLISGSTGLLDPSRKRLRQLGKANEHSVAEKQVSSLETKSKREDE